MSSKNIQDTKDSFGGRLRFYRKQMGWNGEKFSNILGISQGSLSAIENDKTVTSAQTIGCLVQNTEINVYWLFTGEGPMVRHEVQPELSMEGEAPPIYMEEDEAEGLEQDILQQVIEGVEEGLADMELELAPAKKAELISLLYDHFSKGGREYDSREVARYLRLVA